MRPSETCKTYLESFGQRPKWGMDGKAYRYKSFLACKDRVQENRIFQIKEICLNCLLRSSLFSFLVLPQKMLIYTESIHVFTDHSCPASIKSSNQLFSLLPLPFSRRSTPFQAPYGFIMHPSDKGLGKCAGDSLATLDRAKCEASCTLDLSY